MALHVVILAGGSGERFWPVSREARPKQFLAIGARESLLRQTWKRARLVAPARDILVVAGRGLTRRIRREIPELPPRGLLLEPAARNTGPALLLAAREIARRDPGGGEMLVLPSDHRVSGRAAFRAGVSAACRAARRGFLLTFGVRPAGPDPELGYIVPGGRLHPPALRVARFVEKPPPAAARRLIGRGALWNTGIFVWRAADFLEEAGRCEPGFRRWIAGAGRSRTLPASSRRGFARVPALPVDRAVLERSRRVAVIPARFGWSDLGSWAALERLLPADPARNRRWGDLLAVDSRGNLAASPGGLTVLAGVRDLLVASWGGATLVCPRNRVGEMRTLVRRLREAGLREHL